MRFDWDDRKARSNRQKHGIAFEVAITAFDDPFALIAEDPKHSGQEKREWLIGEADPGVLVVIFTVRHPGNVFRIISAGRASRKERRNYEKIKKFSL